MNYFLPEFTIGRDKEEKEEKNRTGVSAMNFFSNEMYYSVKVIFMRRYLILQSSIHFFFTFFSFNFCYYFGRLN